MMNGADELVAVSRTVYLMHSIVNLARTYNSGTKRAEKEFMPSDWPVLYFQQ